MLTAERSYASIENVLALFILVEEQESCYEVKK